MRRLETIKQLSKSLIVQLTLISLLTIALLTLLSNLHYSYELRKEQTSLLNYQAASLASSIRLIGAEMIPRNDLPAIQRVLDQIEPTSDLDDFILVDAQGKILAQKTLPDTDNPGFPDSQDFPVDRTVLQKVLADGIQQSFTDSEHVVVIDPIFDENSAVAGEKQVIGAALVKMDIESLDSFVKSMIYLDGWFNFGILASIFILVPLVYFSMVRPLRRVTQAARKIASGSLDTRLTPKGAQEIKDLAESLNTMAESMQVDQQKMQQRLDERKQLFEISTMVGKTFDLDEIFSYLANQMARLIDGTGALIVLWDEELEKPVPQAAYGSFEQFYKSIKTWTGEPTLAAKILETGIPISVYDVLDCPYISPRMAAQFQHKSLLGLPLIINGHAFGAILIGENRCHREFSENEIQLAMSAANQIASAIANAQLILKLRAERNRLKDILNAVSDAIVVTDAKGILQFVNRAFTTITGSNLNLTQRIPLFDLLALSPEELASARAEAITTALQGMTWHREMTGARPNGSTYDADVFFGGIRDLENRFIGYVASIRDISGLKDFDRMKNRFVSTVSHELRTPISVISLYTENLLEFYTRLSDQERLDILADIHTETHSLQKLIEDLLSLSRIDSGRADPQKSDFELVGLLIETINSIKPIAEIKDLNIRFNLPEHPIQIYADHDQIQQVFRNLIGNAVKFTPPKGDVNITYELNHGEITIRFADTGIGIPVEDIPRLFERFFRSENAIKQEIPGTGLGLAITKEILQRHQFSIDVQSELGKGTTFAVTMPVTISGQPMILFLDNDLPCRDTISEVLSADYLLINVSAPDLAWEVLEANVPSLILIAIKQVNQEIIDFVSRLRSMPVFAKVPLVAVCLDRTVLVEHAFVEGIDEIVNSSDTPGDLREVVYRLVSSGLLIG